MRTLTQRRSGLIVVDKQEPAATPTPRNLLEIEFDRKTVAECFTTLLNHSSIGGRGIGTPKENGEAAIRAKLVRQLAEVLLGDDVDFEILT